MTKDASKGRWGLPDIVPDLLTGTAHQCCDRLIRADPWAMSGHRQDGERWTCTECHQEYEHTCDEAEGCAWVRVVAEPETMTVARPTGSWTRYRRYARVHSLMHQLWTRHAQSYDKDVDKKLWQDLDSAIGEVVRHGLGDPDSSNVEHKRCNKAVRRQHTGMTEGSYLCDDEPGHGGRCWTSLLRKAVQT